mmetsp:Transcript_69684/g.219967  ORF Transcript_69684/g.219967 Transcript_69684/m.219967 type:complete len:147 (-) Transcript_69684:142-582(-)
MAEPRPDFSGKWTVVRIEGDMDAFLKESGVSWMVRKMASGMGYGVGKQKQDIAHSGDQLEIVNESPMGKVTITMVINGQEQTAVTPDNEKVLATPCWEPDGATLRVESRKPNGGAVPLQRRFMRGDEMVMELTSPKGTAVSRIFSR